VIVHLVDATYELFRHFFALASHVTDDGQEVGALRGVLGNIVSLLESGATHVAVATDHVIESFRNDLWPGYKTGAGVDAALLSQFTPLEQALETMGVAVLPMVEWEADDAMASAAKVAARDERVQRVVICTPDKDLAQCVSDDRVVQWDRRKDMVLDRAGVEGKFGVPPESIPDWLALVGDSADGFPGIPGFGAKTAAAVLRRYGHLEDIPELALHWDVDVRGATRLAATLHEQMGPALLFRDLATLRTDPPVIASVDELRWNAPSPAFADLAGHIGAPALAQRAAALTLR